MAISSAVSDLRYIFSMPVLQQVHNVRQNQLQILRHPAQSLHQYPKREAIRSHPSRAASLQVSEAFDLLAILLQAQQLRVEDCHYIR